MSEAYFDDDNFDDGFREDSYREGMRSDLWRKLFAYALHYRFDVAMLAFFALCTAAADVAFPLIIREVIDAVAVDGAQANLLGYGLLYLLFVVVLASSVTCFIWFAGKIRNHVSHDIRRDGFANLQRLSFDYFDYRPVGWLMARMTSDCERLSNILAWGMLDLIWGCAVMGGVALAMLWMDALLALAVLLVLPVLAWVSITFQKRILGSARQVRKTNSRITGRFNESIIGVQTSKAFVREQENARQFGELTETMHRASVINAVQAALYLPLVLSLGALATGIALVFGGVQMVGGAVTVGTLVAFLTYTRHFFEPVEELAHWFAEMQMAQASAERIVSLIDAVPSVRDSDEVLQRMAAHGAAGPSGSGSAAADGLAVDGLPGQIRRIEFRDVSFAYPGSAQKVLRHVDLTIERGQTVAIVGPTGGGKTTLASLLCRFYEPTEGSILINDLDYRSRSLDWLHGNLGMVLQQSHIFGGTVRENIRYGRLDADDAAVEQAARLAGADDFIQQLEQGYEQAVGEGGNQLSAGQKQMIAIARAVLADPQILVMDEATSSVDTDTERRLQQGLRALLAGRIAVVIAHRLSTIRNADLILVVEQGQIVERGNHDALLRLGGRYHTLVTQQSIDPQRMGRGSWSAAARPA